MGRGHASFGTAGTAFLDPNKHIFLHSLDACLMPFLHASWRPIIDALDACLMVRGSWLKAHGSWPREAEAHGSWPGASPALGTHRRASGPGPAPRASGSPGPGRPLAMSHEPPLASLGHEP